MEPPAHFIMEKKDAKQKVMSLAYFHSNLTMLHIILALGLTPTLHGARPKLTLLEFMLEVQRENVEMAAGSHLSLM